MRGCDWGNYEVPLNPSTFRKSGAKSKRLEFTFPKNNKCAFDSLFTPSELFAPLFPKVDLAPPFLKVDFLYFFLYKQYV